MMKQTSLPILKTGWLYLLLLIWAMLYWLTDQGSMKALNQWNRLVLQQVVPGTDNIASEIHLQSSLDAEQFASIRQLLNQYPETPLVLLGDVRRELLSQLRNFLSTTSRVAPILVATDNSASIAELLREDTGSEWLNNSLDWLRLSERHNPQWRTADQLVFAPINLNHEGNVQVIWRHRNKLYLSLSGELLRAVYADEGKLEGTWNQSLNFGKYIRLLGLNGEIFNLSEIAKPTQLEAFISKPTAPQTPRVIFIDDRTLPVADQVVHSAVGLLQNHYLYQSLLAWLIPSAILLPGLWFLWLGRRWRLSRQLGGLVGLSIIALALQYIAFTQLQWFAVIPVIVTLLLSWLVMFAYQREVVLFEIWHHRHNQLLSEALPIFYHAHKIERLQPLLNQTQPDLKLAETVFDVALQAEAKNNRPLAKNLLGWIQQSGLKHPPSAQKLTEMGEREKVPSLDSTMVIEPGQSPSQSFSANLYPLENFGRYKVEGILGKGAMGIVYQGVDPKINRHVAIKTLQLNDGDDSERLNETKARFFREAETAGNLSHANIVTIYDVGEEGELGYIAMDLLTGAPLSAFVKPQNRLPAPLIYQLMIQITDALDYAHRQSVVHRDIKPGNIIYDDEVQRVTLTDFGIAFVADNSKTRTGTIMGSPYYMSPEQVLGKRVDGRSDIFSLGVTFYQLLGGHLPFDGESIASVAYHITNSKQVSVRQWDDHLPSSAARITNKAMQKDAAKRFQTMDEFKQALISALKRDFKKQPIV